MSLARCKPLLLAAVLAWASSLFILAPRAASAVIEVGDPAPAFARRDHEGRLVDLKKRQNQGRWTVLVFHPGVVDDGSLLQAWSYRAVLDRLQSREVEVLAISPVEREASARFARRQELAFPMIDDENGQIAESFGLADRIGRGARVTIILDDRLVVRYVEDHPDPAFDGEWTLEIIDELKAAQAKKGGRPVPH